MFQIETINNKIFYFVTTESEIPQILAIDNKTSQNKTIDNKIPNLIINKIFYFIIQK
jgi:hypothetical protein